jgi:hypothetical protein
MKAQHTLSKATDYCSIMVAAGRNVFLPPNIVLSVMPPQCMDYYCKLCAAVYKIEVFV